MNEREIIERAHTELGVYADTVLEACEAFWGHGVSDEQHGSITEPPHVHVYRVARWVVETNSDGFSNITAHASEAQAHADFSVRVGALDA